MQTIKVIMQNFQRNKLILGFIQVILIVPNMSYSNV